MYSFYFMARRMIYAVILINWLDKSCFQVQLVVLLNILFLVYLCYTFPYWSLMANVVEIVNEISTAICTYFLTAFSDFVPDAKIKYSSGWPIVGITCFLIGFNLLIICH